jgi:hypothetical protein
MTSEQYEKHEGEFLKFDRVQNKTSGRADLHAFNLLDKLVPGKIDMVSAAEHDEIWLEVSPDDLAKVATEEQIIDLIRCGVRYDRDTNSLTLFV